MARAGGLVITAVSAFIGVGGGFLYVPFLTSVVGLPMFIVAGTSALTVFVSMITSIGTFMFVKEARRCIRCDICERCGKCEEVCEERLGVSAIKFFHAGESSLILKDYVHELPKCIGCGACVNICPTGALQIEDRGDERVILMTGTVINRMKLETCDGCGKHYVPTVFVRHVGKSVDVEKDAFDRGLCPECKRIAEAIGIAGAEPPFNSAAGSLVSKEARGPEK